VGGLVEDNSGVLYGTAFYSADGGSIFKINKDGSNFTLLKIFTSPDIRYPSAGLVQFGNYLYGTCFYGGVEGKGGVFRIRKDGTGYQEMHVFQGATDGATPYAPLYLASNAKLYGTTSSGGTDGFGTVFRIDTSGSNYTVLKSFSSTADGAYPNTGIIQASDLLLYGSTGSAIGLGVYGGTIFRMNLDGSGYTILHAFDDQAEGQGVSTLLDLNGNFVLPVDLVFFKADKKEQTVLLAWKTAQEQKSDRFEIERSADGNSFHLIGTVAASGNTSMVTSYSFTDHQPLDGINYYRLKQIDIDGLFAYSKIVSADFGKAGKLTVFPNPASDRLHVRWPQDGNFTLIRIINSTGQVVLQKNATSSTAELNLEGLTKGWYTLQLIGKDTKLEKGFLKD
ncbi:MAG TPA: choice-of-anchor tandem repeat GloVer-containing protein, partial [Chitinophagaceae bacterium]|nr:choice-of-anchor tandem repeat GloVer-containing protein [Chitinophagaceae bacterium]